MGMGRNLSLMEPQVLVYVSYLPSDHRGTGVPNFEPIPIWFLEEQTWESRHSQPISWLGVGSNLRRKEPQFLQGHF